MSDEIIVIREKSYRVLYRTMTDEAFRPGAITAHLVVISIYPQAYKHRAVDEFYRGPGRMEYRFANREVEQLPGVDYSERRL